MGTLWYGGRIYTLQEEGHRVEAVFTEGSRIVDLGSMEELKDKYKKQIKDMQNLNGSTMLPGFVDSHMHLIGHGEKLIRLDLSEITSRKELLQAVADYSKQFSHGEWIIGEGWNENLWEDKQPITRFELDEVVPNQPLLLKRVCRHAISVNSAALEAASIKENTPCPPGGVIGKTSNGVLNGIFKDQAQELITEVMPTVSKEYLRKAMRAAIRDAHSLGLTGGHTEDLNYYSGFSDTYNTFQEVIEDEGLKFRSHLLVHHEVIRDFQEFGGEFLKGSDWIEFGAMKIFADGSLGGRTALLSHPYADDPTTNGVAIFTQKELNKLVEKARSMQMPVAVHAIGDRAFEMVVNAIELHPLKGNGRDRLIHAQILRKELIDRIKGLPLILDIQPRFLASDFPWVIDRIGKNQMQYCYAWKSLLDQNLHCAGGSDAPIESLNPILGIHAAVTRKNNEDPKGTVFNHLEALSVYEAVSLFTKGSAYASCHECDRGIIHEGYLADFTIVDQDLFEIDPDRIVDVKVRKTVIGGQSVYSVADPS